jgi:hypothetical protein
LPFALLQNTNISATGGGSCRSTGAYDSGGQINCSGRITSVTVTFEVPLPKANDGCQVQSYTSGAQPLTVTTSESGNATTACSWTINRTSNPIFFFKSFIRGSQ